MISTNPEGVLMTDSDELRAIKQKWVGLDENEKDYHFTDPDSLHAEWRVSGKTLRQL